MLLPFIIISYYFPIISQKLPILVLHIFLRKFPKNNFPSQKLKKKIKIFRKTIDISKKMCYNIYIENNKSLRRHSNDSLHERLVFREKEKRVFLYIHF